MRNRHPPRFEPVKILLPCYLSAPISNANILWGGAATALLGATLAEWQRKRAEEEMAVAGRMRGARRTKP
ncbi:MAG: hypothetical protein IPP55_01805 [Anaerolineales bacterium]|jgi:hypothetical protein|nr:hypothetical protein [Anaerolineales bacterium]